MWRCKNRYDGSSPHAWGILSHAFLATMPTRFIPTCVGNTGPLGVIPAALPVHPHMRGEYPAASTVIPVPGGSSPHAWGILPQSFRRLRIFRFIPTCVGNTRSRRHAGQRVAVHPHMRGEYLVSLNVPAMRCGSSPHAWGIRWWEGRGLRMRRFIPTCVGNTQPRLAADMEYPVHPHMRGEYKSPAEWIRTYGGSSPHAWGIRLLRSPDVADARFIPTCVGNTYCSKRSSRSHTVHPHMRGEYSCTLSASCPLIGSSPHAWGILKKPTLLPPLPRFIPTCVGNT